MKLLAAITALALGWTPASAQIFVSPAGDDGGPGTFERPFASLVRAQREVRALRRTAPERGVVVMLRGGVHRLQQPLEFGPDDGGDETREVTWSALPGESVVITGGRVVRGWKAADGGVVRAPLPAQLAGREVRDLFDDERRLPRARFPNVGWLRVAAAGADRRTSFSFEPGVVPDIGSAAGLEVQLMHDWSSSRVAVAEIDTAKGHLRTRTRLGCAAPYFAIDNFEPHPRFALEGHAALLDAPGEWCQDPRTGDLLLIPPRASAAPVDLASLELEVPALERLLEIRGSPERPVRRLRLIGLQLRHSAFEPPPGGWAGGQASGHEARTHGDTEAEAQRVFAPAAVVVTDAADCTFEACTLSALGATGLWIGPGCRDVTVRRSVVRAVGANGINIGEDGSREAQGEPWWRSSTPDDPRVARRITVEGCTISDAGQVYPGAVGVWIGFAAACRVAFNDIHDLPYTGISVGWVWAQDPSPCGGHRIENNDIQRVMTLLSDGGCIYTLGRQPGTTLRGNYLHGVQQQAGRAPSNGIFMDEGTCEIVVEGNLIEDISEAPIRFHRAGRNLVTDNTFVTRRADPFQFNATEVSDVESRNNAVRPASEPQDRAIERAAGTRGLP